MLLARLLAFAALCSLPGAWLGFGLRLPGTPLGARALLSVVLSPVVVLAQFYLLRGLGIAFDPAVWLLLVLNLPALEPIRRRWRASGRPDSRTLVPYALLWVLPIGLLFFYFHDLAANALRAHTFAHGDLVYGLANGWLKVEEAQLAGLTSGYPWGGHVHQAVLSRVLLAAPVGSFAWTNIVLLVAGVSLMAHVTGRLGGGAAARILTLIWVLFAVNAVGHALREFLVPEEILGRYPIWGDPRFTPWMRKYTLWNQHPHAHGLFAGLLFFITAPRRELYARSTVIAVAALVGGLAPIYPVFMPAVGGVLAARLAWDLHRRSERSWATFARDSLLPLGAIGLVGVLLTLGTLWVVGEHRAAGAGLGLASAWQLKTKAAETLISLAPLLLGTGALLARRKGAVPGRWGVLLLAGLASAGLFVIPGIRGRIEYKFMFTAAMCLAPLAALGCERWLEGRARAVAYAALLLFFVGMGADRLVRLRFTGEVPFPIVLDGFDTKLPRGHELAEPLQALRDGTEPETVVAIDSVDVHVPIFARRSLYAPPHTEEVLLGVGMGNRLLLAQNRGYGEEVVDRRQETTRRLFGADSPALRREALDEIRRLGRPVAVLLETERHSALFETLLEAGGETLYRGPRWAVWAERAAGARRTPGARSSR